MSLTKFNGDTNNIQGLADRPTQSASDLKAKFDKVGEDLKKYINETLTPEIDTALNNINEKCKVKGDFAVITGNMDVAAFAFDQDFINYPQGFNKDNTIVLSTMEEIFNSQYYNTIICYDRGDNFTISENAVDVTLMPDNIRVRLNNNDNSFKKTFNYKIVLMKIS